MRGVCNGLILVETFLRFQIHLAFERTSRETGKWTIQAEKGIRTVVDTFTLDTDCSLSKAQPCRGLWKLKENKTPSIRSSS